MVDLRIRLDERHRAAFLEGAGERSRTVEGRPLTTAELERVTKRIRARRAKDHPDRP